MKAITPALSLAALLGALIILPGCSGGDEAAPPADATATPPAGDAEAGATAEPGITGAVDESAPAEAPAP